MWLKKGGTIFSSQPYASVLYCQYREVVCHHCYAAPSVLDLTCPECSLPSYCSRRCLQADSATHSLECDLLATGDQPEDPTAWLLLRYTTLTPSILLMLLYLYYYKRREFMVKNSLTLTEILRAEPEGFTDDTGCISPYPIPNNDLLSYNSFNVT